MPNECSYEVKIIAESEKTLRMKNTRICIDLWVDEDADISNIVEVLESRAVEIEGVNGASGWEDDDAELNNETEEVSKNAE